MVTLVHEEKKPLKCKTCDYNCFKKPNLDQHIELVHEENCHTGITPLHKAAENGHLGAAESILGNVQNRNLGFHTSITPLHRAAENGHLGVAESILRKDVTCHNGITPLHGAAENGQVGVAELILGKD